MILLLQCRELNWKLDPQNTPLLSTILIVPKSSGHGGRRSLSIDTYLDRVRRHLSFPAMTETQRGWKSELRNTDPLPSLHELGSAESSWERRRLGHSIQVGIARKFMCLPSSQFACRRAFLSIPASLAASRFPTWSSKSDFKYVGSRYAIGQFHIGFALANSYTRSQMPKRILPAALLEIPPRRRMARVRALLARRVRNGSSILANTRYLRRNICSRFHPAVPDGGQTPQQRQESPIIAS